MANVCATRWVGDTADLGDPAAPTEHRDTTMTLVGAMLARRKKSANGVRQGGGTQQKPPIHGGRRTPRGRCRRFPRRRHAWRPIHRRRRPCPDQCGALPWPGACRMPGPDPRCRPLHSCAACPDRGQPGRLRALGDRFLRCRDARRPCWFRRRPTAPRQLGLCRAVASSPIAGPAQSTSTPAGVQPESAATTRWLGSRRHDTWRAPATSARSESEKPTQAVAKGGSGRTAASRLPGQAGCSARRQGARNSSDSVPCVAPPRLPAPRSPLVISIRPSSGVLFGNGPKSNTNRPAAS